MSTFVLTVNIPRHCILSILLYIIMFTLVNTQYYYYHDYFLNIMIIASYPYYHGNILKYSDICLLSLLSFAVTMHWTSPRVMTTRSHGHVLSDYKPLALLLAWLGWQGTYGLKSTLSWCSGLNARAHTEHQSNSF